MWASMLWFGVQVSSTGCGQTEQNTYSCLCRADPSTKTTLALLAEQKTGIAEAKNGETHV